MLDNAKLLNQKESFLKLFEASRSALSAIGDETRQLIIKTLIEHSGEGGLRVGEIQKNTSISRTAVSHHLKVLRDAEVITMTRIGTKNYYILDSQSSSLRLVSEFWRESEAMMSMCENNKRREYHEFI